MTPPPSRNGKRLTLARARAASVCACLISAGAPALGCGGHEAGHGHGNHYDLPLPAPILIPDPHEGLPALGSASDLNADPGVLEVELVARLGEAEYFGGTRTAVWSYGGTVPGPLLERGGATG